MASLITSETWCHKCGKLTPPVRLFNNFLQVTGACETCVFVALAEADIDPDDINKVVRFLLDKFKTV